MASPGCRHPKGDTPSHTADGKKPAAAAAAAPGRGDGKEAPAAKRAGMMRLPKEEVAQILSRDPRSMEPYKVEAMHRMLQQVRPDGPEEPLRVLAKSLNENARKKFIVFQDWARGEYDGKGCVEVTEEFIRDKEEVRKGKERQIPVDIDPYLPADEYFGYVSGKEDGGEEELYFLLSKEKDASDSMEWSEDEDEDEEESDEDEEESESDEEDDD